VADLSDKRMQELVDTLDCPDPDEVASMIDEVRRRRAADLTDADREALRFLLTTYGKVPEDRGEREVYDNHVHAARLLCERLIGAATTRVPNDVLRSGIIAEPAPTAVECEENRRANRACPSNCRQRRHHSGDQ
jgi:hypothetical protein